MSVKVEVTHADRVMFPSDGITKGDLVEYYTEIAEAMVPHLKGRPLTLWRYPRGIDQDGFVQQDFADSLPGWMGRVRVSKEGGTVVHPTADRRDALRWLANQNCVIVHAWLSKRDRLHTPDRIVFDLDPSVDDFAVVKATARTVADVLDELGLVSYVQTTGSRGLHVVTPIKAGRRLRHRAAIRPRRRRCGCRRRPRSPHRRGPQGQARQAPVPRRHAKCLRADRGRAVRRPRPPRGTGSHPAGVG